MSSSYSPGPTPLVDMKHLENKNGCKTYEKEPRLFFATSLSSQKWKGTGGKKGVNAIPAEKGRGNTGSPRTATATATGKRQML